MDKRRGRPRCAPTLTARIRCANWYALTALRKKGETENDVLARVIESYLGMCSARTRMVVRKLVVVRMKRIE